MLEADGVELATDDKADESEGELEIDTDVGDGIEPLEVGTVCDVEDLLDEDEER